MRGPSDSRTMFGLLQQRGALVVGEAALRSDQHRHRLGRRRAAIISGSMAVGAAARGQRGDRILHLGRPRRRTPADGPACGRRACAQTSAARRSRESHRMPHCSAASTALACIRSRLMRLTWVWWVVHRLQPRHADLDRLLHHIVEPLVLERREQVMQVGRLVCGRTCSCSQHLTACRDRQQRRPPFAVAAIEQQHRVAGLEPQHVAQIMRLDFLPGASAPALSGPST